MGAMREEKERKGKAGEEGGKLVDKHTHTHTHTSLGGSCYPRV